MRRSATVVLFTVLVFGAPVALAHDHSGEGGWSVLESGPRLGLPADAVLRAAPIRGSGAVPPLGKFERLALQGDAGGQVGEPAGESMPARAGDGFTVQLHHTGVEAAEPTLGVTSKGTVFFVGFGAPQESTIVRSRDGGRTWEETNPVTPAEGDTTSFDPYIHVDHDTDRVFNADLALVVCSVISTSDDEGETFPATGQICQHTDHQNLFTGPPPEGTPAPVGYPNVVYYCAIDGGAFFNFGTFTGCSRSLDGGINFVRTAPPFTNDPTRTGGHYGVQGHCGGNVAHGTVGHDGTVYLPRGFCDRPYLAISRDQGVTWERVQVADLGMAVGPLLEEHEASVAVDSANNLYYAWIATDRLPYIVVSRDGGKTWSAPRMMAAPGVNEAWNVVIDVGDPGRIAFSFIGTTNSPGGPFCSKTTSGGCETDAGEPGPDAARYRALKTAWHGYMGVSLNALDTEPTFKSTTVNDPATPLMRATPCGPPRCGTQFDFLDIDVAPDGSAWAAYVDERCDPDPEGGCPEAEGAVGHLVAPLKGPLPAPPPAPTPTPPAQPLGAATPKPRCLSGRRLKVRVPKPKRGRVRSVRVTANGRRVKVARNKRTATVDLRRVGRNRKLTVKIVIRTTAGRRSTKIKRYRTCA